MCVINSRKPSSIVIRMNRINYSTSMAPVLDSLFDKFSQTGTLNYCLICLRTERRLVKNRAFKKFTSAMKLDKRRWQHQQICYMCERQASNALKFFNAATFAAAIDTIFSEIIYEKRKNKTNVFENVTLNRILNKFGLDRHKASPLEWDLDLEAIRKSSQLIETQPLLVDNLNSNTVSQFKVISVQRSDSPEELYVIPDDPPTSPGEAVGEQPQNTQQPAFGTAVTNIDDTFMLGSSEPKISETLVILDEDEDKDPLQIRIDSVVSNAVPPPQPISQPLLKNILTKPIEPPPCLMTPSNAPILVPLESLLEQPKEIFTGDVLLVGSPEGNYTVHPIAIKEGVTTVPSLDAKFINGQLIYDRNPQLSFITPMNIKNLTENHKDILQNNLFPQINVVSTLQTSVDDNSKTNKRDLPDVVEQNAAPNKISKVLPAKEQSETDKRLTRIDWEDKIPMDIISYIDAVDPNQDPRVETKRRQPEGCNLNSKLHTNKDVPRPSDVIDLC